MRPIDRPYPMPELRIEPKDDRKEYGPCPCCGQEIYCGDDIYYFGDEVYHEDCFEDNVLNILAAQYLLRHGVADD